MRIKQIRSKRHLYVSPLLPYCKGSPEVEKGKIISPWKSKNGTLHWREKKPVEERSKLTIRGSCSIEPLYATPVGTNQLQSQKGRRYRPNQVRETTLL